MQNSAMASLLSRSFECRRTDTENALKLAKASKAMILRLPQESPDSKSLTVLHHKLSEKDFLTRFLGSFGNLAEF